MRIGVFFSPWSRTASPTGVGRHALEMVGALAGRNDVELCLLASGSDVSFAEAIASERAGDAAVYCLPGSDRVTRLLFSGLRLLPVDRWVNGVDWIYCSKEQPLTSRQVRLAVNVHDVLSLEPDVDGLAPPQWHTRLRWTHVMRGIRHADLVTTVSEFTKCRLVERCGMDPDRIMVAGNGVSEVYFREPRAEDLEVLKKYNVSPREYFFSCGSLTRRKGGDLLLEAAQRLRGAGYRMPILLSGRRHDSDLMSRYQGLSDEERMSGLRLLGYIPDEDQAVLLTHALAFVFPSRYEGFGIPVLEAMAAGTIVVCSRISALVEVCGDAALFMERSSAVDLTRLMCDVIRGSFPMEQNREAGRRRAEEFRWERCASRLVAAMSQRDGLAAERCGAAAGP